MPGDDEIVRNAAQVTVTEAVSGETRRKAPRGHSRSSRTKTVKVREEVMTVARKVIRPGEVLVVINERCVELVPRQ